MYVYIWDQRMLDPLKLELQVAVASWYGCWELKLGSLQEQYVFLTTELFLQPWKAAF